MYMYLSIGSAHLDKYVNQNHDAGLNIDKENRKKNFILFDPTLNLGGCT